MMPEYKQLSHQSKACRFDPPEVFPQLKGKAKHQIVVLMVKSLPLEITGGLPITLVPHSWLYNASALHTQFVHFSFEYLIFFGHHRISCLKSWNLARGVLQHLEASLYIKLYHDDNIIFVLRNFMNLMNNCLFGLVLTGQFYYHGDHEDVMICCHSNCKSHVFKSDFLYWSRS